MRWESLGESRTYVVNLFPSVVRNARLQTRPGEGPWRKSGEREKDVSDRPTSLPIFRGENLVRRDLAKSGGGGETAAGE